MCMQRPRSKTIQPPITCFGITIYLLLIENPDYYRATQPPSIDIGRTGTKEIASESSQTTDALIRRDQCARAGHDHKREQEEANGSMRSCTVRKSIFAI